MLWSLDISDMNIQDSYLAELFIRLTSNIEHSNIAGNDISEFTIYNLASYLSFNPPLKFLNISGYGDNEHYQSIIRSEDVSILFQGLSQNSQLTHLDLSYINLDYESIAIIAKYLK